MNYFIIYLHILGDRMDLYYRVILSEEDKITYFHVFSGEHYKGYVTIDKSYFEFGMPKQNFQKPGEEIFIGSSKTETDSEMRHMLIESILSGDFDFEVGRIIKKNEL